MDEKGQKIDEKGQKRVQLPQGTQHSSYLRQQNIDEKVKSEGDFLEQRSILLLLLSRLLVIGLQTRPITGEGQFKGLFGRELSVAACIHQQPGFQFLLELCLDVCAPFIEPEAHGPPPDTFEYITSYLHFLKLLGGHFGLFDQFRDLHQITDLLGQTIELCLVANELGGAPKDKDSSFDLLIVSIREMSVGHRLDVFDVKTLSKVAGNLTSSHAECIEDGVLALHLLLKTF